MLQDSQGRETLRRAYRDAKNLAQRESRSYFSHPLMPLAQSLWKRLLTSTWLLSFFSLVTIWQRQGHPQWLFFLVERPGPLGKPGFQEDETTDVEETDSLELGSSY